MANMFRVQGAAGLMKEGARIFGGNEAKIKNCEAVRQLSDVLKTSMGPQSCQKMIVSHIDKVFVTSDASTIVEQMEVQHPAAKMIIKAAGAQCNEFGDQTSFLMCFSGELLSRAANLMHEGLHVVDIIRGFELAAAQCDEAIDKLCVYSPLSDDFKTSETLSIIAHSAISSKASDYRVFLSELVGKAAQLVLSQDPKKFRAHNVRTVKVPGGSFLDSYVVRGMLIPRGLSSSRKTVEHSEEKPLKCLILNVDLAASSTDTTGNVLITDADNLSTFNREEDKAMYDFVQKVKDKGVRAIIVGGHINDTAKHFCDDAGLIVFRVTSKFELKRLCMTLGGAAMTKLVEPKEDDLGIAQSIKELEIGSTKCTIIEAIDSNVASVVLRGSAIAALDEYERAIGDGLGVIEAATKDSRFVAGGGAVDMALSVAVEAYASRQKGLEQYSAKAFAESLKMNPGVLIENSGLPRTSTFTSLTQAHKEGNTTMGINMETASIGSMYEEGRDGFENHITHLEGKKWAIKFAVDAANTILNVDQIIMARPAGGPKLPSQGHWDAQDDKMPLDNGY